MQIKIAVIGSAEFLQHAGKAARQMDGLTIIPGIYDQPQAAPSLLGSLEPYDALFFSGALPYHFSKDLLASISCPISFLEQNELALSLSLLSIQRHHGIPLERISVDVFNTSFIPQLLEEIGAAVSMEAMDYKDMLDHSFQIDRIVDFHKESFHKKKTDIALTSIHAVYHRLKELGLPAEKVIDPYKSLLDGLQQLKTQAELLHNRASTLAIAIIQGASDDRVKQAALKQLIQSLQAAEERMENGSTILFTTRGSVERVIQTDLLVKVLQQTEANIGLGYGQNVLEAKDNAQSALHFAARSRERSACYLITDTKKLIGPLPVQTTGHHLAATEQSLLDISKETGLGPANVSKVIQFCEIRSQNQFTAADLTHYLQVTRRTTERILKKLSDHGYVKIVGEEMAYQQGRPRSIYELQIHKQSGKNY
ncbi:transcriptional regulator [Bacillus sp. 1P06AnD]|uniref:transcriptional regulator n=1 Tax=Bacillus sp. 1P06AnD TaxID=3132208 RepID=UPI00399F428F